jgi:hypothetical protein
MKGESGNGRPPNVSNGDAAHQPADGLKSDAPRRLSGAYGVVSTLPRGRGRSPSRWLSCPPRPARRSYDRVGRPSSGAQGSIPSPAYRIGLRSRDRHSEQWAGRPWLYPNRSFRPHLHRDRSNHFSGRQQREQDACTHRSLQRLVSEVAAGLSRKYRDILRPSGRKQAKRESDRACRTPRRPRRRIRLRLVSFPRLQPRVRRATQLDQRRSRNWRRRRTRALPRARDFILAHLLLRRRWVMTTVRPLSRHRLPPPTRAARRPLHEGGKQRRGQPAPRRRRRKTHPRKRRARC